MDHVDVTHQQMCIWMIAASPHLPSQAGRNGTAADPDPCGHDRFQSSTTTHGHGKGGDLHVTSTGETIEHLTGERPNPGRPIQQRRDIEPDAESPLGGGERG